MTSQVAQPQPKTPASPSPALGSRYQLTAANGAALNNAVLPASNGTLLKTEIVPCYSWDAAMLEIFYDANAATTTGQPQIIPYVSNSTPTSDQTQAPLLTDDVWVKLPSLDGSIVVAAVAATQGVGGVTSGPLEGVQSIYGLVIKGEAAVANSNKTRHGARIDVRGWRWLVFGVCELTDNVNPGKLRLFVTGAV